MNSPKYQVVCQWCGAKSNKVTGFTVEKWMSRHDAKHEAAILFTPAPPGTPSKGKDYELPQ